MKREEIRRLITEEYINADVDAYNSKVIDIVDSVIGEVIEFAECHIIKEKGFNFQRPTKDTMMFCCLNKELIIEFVKDNDGKIIKIGFSRKVQDFKRFGKEGYEHSFKISLSEYKEDDEFTKILVITIIHGLCGKYKFKDENDEIIEV